MAILLSILFCCTTSSKAWSQQKVAYATTPRIAPKIHSDRFEFTYGPSIIEVDVYGSNWSFNRSTMQSWVRDAIHSVISYYGRYPLKSTRITIEQTESRGVGYGTAFFNNNLNQGRINILLGKYTKEDDLKNSWTLTHEMVHMTFPLVNNDYNWITEGIATYAEPIGRLRQGLISKETVWKDLIEGLPKGLPKAGDKGLNRTHTWGRTYWGGALFCLLADIEIRKSTDNKLGLEHALRGIMDKGVTAESNLLSAPEILKIGDNATGVQVLSKLYNTWKNKPVDVDLDLLFKRLGVSVVDNKVIFDDNAPLAQIRRSIESGKS